MHYVYCLHFVDTDNLYIGRSDNLKRRLNEHYKNKVTSTKKFATKKLIFYEAFSAKEDSIRKERYFKTSKGKSSLKQIIRQSLKN